MSQSHIDDDRLSEFHVQLEHAARQYKEKFKINSIKSDSFASEFLKHSREMEFKLLDVLVHRLKSEPITEVAQQFVLKVLKGEVSVSCDRYENLVHLAKQYLSD